MTPGYLLQTGDALHADDLRTFYEGVGGVLCHAPVGRGMERVGSAGGIVTVHHGHFFRPYTKPELPNPDVEKAQADLMEARNQIAALNSANQAYVMRIIQLEAVNEELRRPKAAGGVDGLQTQ